MPNKTQARVSRKMLFQERLYSLVKFKAVLIIREAVPLVLLGQIFDRDAVLFERRDQLIGFVDVEAWILCALRSQERCVPRSLISRLLPSWVAFGRKPVILNPIGSNYIHFVEVTHATAN
jgi:hypothetical protein